MKKYRKRIADDILARKLEGKGAVLIEGPKWCGKTTTAEQIAASILYMAEPEKKEISIEEVRAVLAAKTQAGKRREVKELLLKYDSGKLSGVKPENYAALMADAEAL